VQQTIEMHSLGGASGGCVLVT